MIDKINDIEEEITLMEHQLMIAVRRANPPESPEQNQLLQAMYSMAAAMVGADGKIEQHEMIVAEEIGARLFEDFDATDFRDYCRNLDQIPDAVEVTTQN